MIGVNESNFKQKFKYEQINRLKSAKEINYLI